MNQNRNPKEFFLIAPVDPAFCHEGEPQFVITNPMRKEELPNKINDIKNRQKCEIEMIQIIELHMEKEEFIKIKAGDSFYSKETKETILSENNKNIESLATLSANKLVQHPSFFKPNKATIEATE